MDHALLNAAITRPALGWFDAKPLVAVAACNGVEYCHASAEYPSMAITGRAAQGYAATGAA